MEGMGEEKFYFHPFNSVKRQKPLSGKASQPILSLIVVCLPFTGLLLGKTRLWDHPFLQSMQPVFMPHVLFLLPKKRDRGLWRPLEVFFRSKGDVTEVK